MRSSSGPTVSDVGRLHGTIDALILSESQDSMRQPKQAIWLQTEQGNDWEWDNEENEVLHVPISLRGHCRIHTNKRIEKYLEREHE